MNPTGVGVAGVSVVIIVSMIGIALFIAPLMIWINISCMRREHAALLEKLAGHMEATTREINTLRGDLLVAGPAVSTGSCPKCKVGVSLNANGAGRCPKCKAVLRG